MAVGERTMGSNPASDGRGRHYKWIALSNTTLGILMVTINQSILLISLPGLFRGIKLNPLEPSNTSYFLWVFMGFMLVTAVLVVSLGRVGDIYGRVRMYNLGFAVFTFFSILLSVTWLTGAGRRAVDHHHAGLPGGRRGVPVRQLQRDPDRRLPRGRAGQGDGHQRHRRGERLVPRPDPRRRARPDRVAPGVPGLGAVRPVRYGLGLPQARDNGVRIPAKIDWLGNALFAVGLIALLTGIVYSLLPYGGHPTGWTNPWVLTAVFGGIAVLGPVRLGGDQGGRADVPAEPVPDPRVHHGQHRRPARRAGPRRPAVHADHLAAGHLAAAARLQLQPDAAVGGHLHDPADPRVPPARPDRGRPVRPVRRPGAGHRRPAVSGASFLLLELLPINFSYIWFALLIFLFAIGMGLFFSPNQAAVMNSLPPDQRGAGAGMLNTFQNSATVLSMGLFFTIVTLGLAARLPATCTRA